MKNYYDILGLEQTNDMDEIKKTYRKLTMKYHPDKNDNNLSFTEKCKEINEAYDILGDKEKKYIYDNELNNFNLLSKINIFGIPNLNTYNTNQYAKSSVNNNNNKFYNHDNLINNNDLLNIFSNLNMHELNMHELNMHELNMHELNSYNIDDNIILYAKKILQEELIQKDRIKKEKKEKLKKEKLEKEKLEKPECIKILLKIDLLKSYKGCVEPIEITRWILKNNIKIEEKETIYVNIDKGIDDNEIILLKNKGHFIDDNNIGDVKIYIKVINNTEYKRNGLDLIYEKNITLKESLCGFVFNLKFIDGTSFKLINKKGNIILSNTNKIISKLGMEKENNIGNLIIKFIIINEKLSIDQINKLEVIL